MKLARALKPDHTVVDLFNMEEKLSNPNLKEQIKVVSNPKKPLPKMLVLLGIAVIIIAMLGIAFTILRNEKIQDLRDNTPTTSETTPGEILFSTPEILVTGNQTQTVDIEVNSSGNSVDGVVIAIKYNPLLIRNVKLEAVKDDTSPLSQVLEPLGETEYDTVNGGALLSLKSLAKDPMPGQGKVARLTFSKANLNVAVNSTEITFLPSTNFLTVDKGYIPLTKNLVTVSF